MLTAAEALVDREGYDALTMTLLAAEPADTRVSSLYNHVANLEDLRAEIQVRAMELLGKHVRRAAMGHAGADGLRVLSHALPAFALRVSAPLRRDHPRAHQPRRLLRGSGGDHRGALGDGAIARPPARSGSCRPAWPSSRPLHGFVSPEASGYFGGDPRLDSVFEQAYSRGAVTPAVLEATSPDAASPYSFTVENQHSHSYK